MQQIGNEREKSFWEYEALCKSNTEDDVGLVVCMHVRKGLCTISNRTKRGNTKGGNAVFHRNVEMDQNNEKAE